MGSTALDEIDVHPASVEELEQLWKRDAPERSRVSLREQATITITRNAADDFQDRQIYLWLDGESLGKIRYGRSLTREVEPGRHYVKAFNTLFSHTLPFDVAPGEHVRLRCRNGIPAAGWLMLIFLHVTALRVRVEREE